MRVLIVRFDMTIKNTILLILVGVLILGVAASAFLISRSDLLPPENIDFKGNSTDVTKEGSIACLPYKEKAGTQTLECALGLKADDDFYYALDTSNIQNELWMPPVNERYKISGRFTPPEVLSSDYWYKYDIKGIITIEKIDKV